ncbi:AMSH-like ubiquitin thioesterase 3 [Acorus calamus]|uniref:AMSH-like ubiquitin thioesterase 3 n=1 Tax=Acorus calamus TaxID=4465 RepID=A0AAV9ES91_ACOCL|nr:AMSH-like ubiquitin thioesterase 3 [Acorus calamus]
MGPSVRAIDINACAPRIEVDNRLSLRYYYRIAQNLLYQANVYREEKNLLDLYVILLRFSSLMCDTIPYHRDYQIMFPKEKAIFKKKLRDVINELESLKPIVQRQADEKKKEHLVQRSIQTRGSRSSTTAFGLPSTKNHATMDFNVEQTFSRSSVQPLHKQNNHSTQGLPSNDLQIDRQMQKLSLTIPQAKEETLSRHSILGPNGLRGQWQGPRTSIRVQYPTHSDLAQTEISGLNLDGQNGFATVKDDNSNVGASEMESVLSLDDGRWLRPLEESCSLSAEAARDESFQSSLIRQPAPPPVLAQVQELPPISPSKVADPRPGPARPLDHALPDSKSYQNLHIPVGMMECFLRIAESNTLKNLETCGVLAGKLKSRMFYVTTLVIPKQEATSDSCQTMNEEEIFDAQDTRSLIPLGWIHTHPSQTCFMSSIDLHTHYSYQIMLPEAIAIVMAPTDTSRNHGIFHLSDPGGVSVIRNCQQRGFHPHEEPPDGSPLYEHCSHVYMNHNFEVEVLDLR